MPLPLSRMLPVVVLVAAFATTSRAQKPSKSEKAAPVDPGHAAKMAKGRELFESSVRGLLEAKCAKCHSGDRVESEFDITSRESLLKGGLAGPAIVPGDHKKSLLYQLVAHQKEPHMPESRPKLPDADLAKIAQWIDLGAPYDRPLLEKDDATAWTRKVVPAEAKEHWAFQPLRQDAQSNSVDAILLAKLKEKGLGFNPPAGKRTLIRRVYLDLIGLPPTPEQVQAFLKDESPEAFAKVVGGLLASPRYGERWARHWLDLVRFAESHGFEHDYDRPTAYHYRDFVIKAFNQDLPFDTFMKWQLAGDEIAPDEPLALMATGYLAAGVHSTHITKSEVEKHRYDELDDIVANIGTTFLGLTVGCARCHDHKYDPIPSRDYYRMISAFTTTVRTEYEIDLNPEGYKKAKAAYDAEHQPYLDAIAKFEKEQLPDRLAEWEETQGKAIAPDWILPEVTQAKSTGGATIAKQPDGSLLVSGKNPTLDTLSVRLATDLTDLRSLRIEALTDPSLVKGGPGRAANGNFALSDLIVAISPKDKSQPGVEVKLANPRATFEQKGFAVAGAIDADSVTSAWAVDPQFGKDHAAAFEFEKPIGYPGGTVIVVTMKFNNNTGHSMGRPRLSLSTANQPDLKAPAASDLVRAALALPADLRTKEHTSALMKWYAPQDPEWQKLAKAAAGHAAKAPRPNRVKALISSEGLPAVRLHSQGDDFLKQTHFLRRGDPGQKTGVAPVSFLQVLMPNAEAQSKWLTTPPSGSRTSFKRTAFANWLADTHDGAGHLLARVIVNRLWERHMGRGIAATVSDFGLRGEPPSHPELLDFLASELIRTGWKLKPIHKLIVISDAYRQASAVDEAKVKVDPDNRLFGRYEVRRLEAEVIRDSILVVGGLLDDRMFGPGTLDESSRRRSIYFTMKRSKLIPSLIVFDAPDGTTGVGSRPSTTIAPQALHLMNNEQVRAAAKGLAKRVLGDGKASNSDAVTKAYRIALCREPRQQELLDAAAFFNGYTGAAREAALADICQVLFCLNEFLYVE